MLVAAFVLCVVFVSAEGSLYGGNYRVPVKRSDYSMYDNQFFRVGDTELDNEVTDCALVKHQYRRGFIRLREYLERMEGCGRKGKLRNIQEIRKSTTEGALTHFPHYMTQAKQVHPKTTAHLSLQPTRQQPPALRTNIRTGNFINGIQYQGTGGLSYMANVPSYYSPPQQAYHAPKTFRFHNRQQITVSPDAQRYYANAQKLQQTQAYGVPIMLGEPMYRTSLPHPQVPQNAKSAYKSLINSMYSPYRTSSAGPHPKAYNPDRNVINVSGETRSSPASPSVKARQQNRENNKDVPAEDIDSDQSEDGIADEGTAANIVDNMPETAEEETHGKVQVKSGVPMVRDETPTPTTLPSIQNPQVIVSAPALTRTPSSHKVESNNRFTANPANPDSELSDPKTVDPFNESSNSASDDSSSQENKQLKGFLNPGSDTSTQEVTSSQVQNDQQPQPAPTQPVTVSNTQQVTPSIPQVNQTAALSSPDQNSPAMTSSSADDMTPSLDQEDPNQGMTSSQGRKTTNGINADVSASGKSPPEKPNIAINLEVLKNKILHTTNSGFLKRMLTLIRKITHHKDFGKLAVMQKSAIMGMGKAVGQAVGDPNAVRSHIQARPPVMQPGDFTAYARTNNAITGNRFYKPPHMQPGDFTSLTNTPGQGAETKINPSYQVSKKFQIERYPYQAPRQVAYVPPYVTLQRLNYGIYNGNAP